MLPLDRTEASEVVEPAASGLRHSRAPYLVELVALGVVVLLAGCGREQQVAAPQSEVVRGEAFNQPVSVETNGMDKANASAGATGLPTNAGTATVSAGAAGRTNGEFLQVGFDKLSGYGLKVVYEMTNAVTFQSAPKLKGFIPDTIKALEGKAVAVTGFMLPLKLEEGRAREFLLMKNRSMCCFGLPLEVTDMIHVRMMNRTAQSIMDQPVTVYGTIHVGEVRENGQIAGIYRMEGSRIEGP